MREPGYGLSRTRTRLSVGANATVWCLYWLFIVPVAAVLVVCSVALWRSEGALAAAVPSLLTLGLVVFAVQVGIASYQSAFWLDGSTLTQRRIRGVRHWDLSVASIAAGNVNGTPTRGKGPALFISGPGMTRLTLGLKRPNAGQTPVPPGELIILADAIAAGRPNDPQVRQLADQLRWRAHSPFGDGW